MRHIAASAGRACHRVSAYNFLCHSPCSLPALPIIKQEKPGINEDTGFNVLPNCQALIQTGATTGP